MSDFNAEADPARWATMPLAARDAAFNNQLAVGAETAKARIARYRAASDALRRAHPGHLDIPYGPKERQRIDVFPAADPQAPCLVFIFGGYWQRNSRHSFSCVAEGVLAHGWSAAFPDYTLAPEATLTDIAGEVRRALDWVAADGERHGAGGPVILSGWSAGGHLSALLADHAPVAAALPVSGIFDLGPLRDVPSVNAKLQLSEAEVETLSPFRRAAIDKPTAIAYGTAELPWITASSRDFHRRRASEHCGGALIPVPHADHFTILEAFRGSRGMLTRAALGLAEEVRSRL